MHNLQSPIERIASGFVQMKSPFERIASGFVQMKRVTRQRGLISARQNARHMVRHVIKRGIL